MNSVISMNGTRTMQVIGGATGGGAAPSLVYDFLVSPDPLLPFGLTTTTTIDADGTHVNSAGLITQNTSNVWPLDYDPATGVEGNELVSNPTLATNANGWTATGAATIVSSGGRGLGTINNAFEAIGTTVTGLTVGQRYRFSGTIERGTITSVTATLTGIADVVAITGSGPQNFTYDFVAISTTQFAGFYSGVTGTFFIDLTSVKPVTYTAKGRPIWEARTNLLLNSLLNGTNLATQDVTVAATPYTISFYGTGTVTLSGASTAGPLVGSGAYPARSTLTFTPSAGTLTLTVTGTVQFANLEAGSFATPFIPTAGAAVARAADACSIALPSGFNASEGTVVAEILTGPNLTTNTQVICNFNDGTANERLTLSNSTFPQAGWAVVDGGVVQANITAGTPTVNTILRYAAAYKANDFALSFNGGAVSTDVSGTLPTVTTLGLGGFTAGILQLNGWLRKLAYYPVRLPNGQLPNLYA